MFLSFGVSPNQRCLLSFCAATATGLSSGALGAMPSTIPALPVVAASLPSVTSVPPTPVSSATVVAPLTPGGSDVALAWASLFSAMSGNPTTPLKSGSERVAIGNGLPTVPKSLVEKIQKWEYVDLADLLPAQSLHDQMTNSRVRFALFPGCELVRSKRRQIESITEWVKAFTVFTAVVAMKEPALVSELLAYQLTIIKAAQSYDGLQWRAYDTHFRVAAAATGNRSWSKLDVDLYTRFFTGRAKMVVCCSLCDSSQHTAANCPVAARRKEGVTPASALPAKRRRSWSPDVCQLFNTSSCSFGLRCKFKHTCGECGGSHSAKACSFTPKSAGGQ